MSYKTVTIIESPVTKRYVQPGSEGQINENFNPPQIRVGGAWFEYNKKKWKVVTEEEKEVSFLTNLKESVDKHDILSDYKFTSLVEAYAITEERAMEWMVKDPSIHRRDNGWYIKS